MMELWNQFWAFTYDKALAYLTQPAGGAGVVELLGSGYSVEEARMVNVEKLRMLCEDAVNNPDFIAHDITGDGVPETFCNRSVAAIAQGMGSPDLRPDMTANQMIAHLTGLPGWREEYDLERVAALALRGVLVVLGVPEPVHGHVVVAAPLPAEASSSWGGPVPMVAQVGAAAIGNGVKRLSAAFRAAARPDLRIFVYEASEA